MAHGGKHIIRKHDCGFTVHAYIDNVCMHSRKIALFEVLGNVIA